SFALVAHALALPKANTSFTSNDRIIGGTASAEGEYPYIVSLLIIFPDSKGLCGGTIIGDRVVVTAAHCVYDFDMLTPIDAENVYVGMGSNSRRRQTRVRAQAVHIHPQFDPNDIMNDIALIIIAPVSLGRSNIDGIQIYGGSIPEGTRLTALGWGQTGTNPHVNSVSDVLKRADIVVGSQADCRQFVPSFVSSDGPQICTENKLLPGDDTCQGDSGTGVVITVRGRRYLAGMTSYGASLQGDPTCALNDGFSIYTHVNYYMGFITAATG
ncbi:trypsin-like serine protease, partial [Martensiomyces pterosporus]